MDNPLPILAAHAAEWRTRPLTPELERHARRALVDWFAALLAGASRSPATLLAAALEDETRGGGGADCYVSGRRVPLRHAALLNGAAPALRSCGTAARWRRWASTKAKPTPSRTMISPPAAQMMCSRLIPPGSRSAATLTRWR